MSNDVIPEELLRRIASDEFTEDVLSAAITQLSVSLSQDDPVANAIMALFIRISNTWASIHALSRHDNPRVRQRCKQDVGALFRVIFEAHVQLAYILHEPDHRQERASLYLDFGVVERMRQKSQVLRQDSNLARVIASSRQRKVGEADLEREFARVVGNFAKSRSRSGILTLADVRTHWYEGSLRDLAIAVGLRSQFDVWIGLYHGCIHSSIGGCRSGPIMDLEYASFWASQVAAHAASFCLKYSGTELDGPCGQWLIASTQDRLGDVPDDVARQMLKARGVPKA